MTTRTLPLTPLGAALRVTGRMALFGVLVRYGWGYFDADMRTWSFVVISPLPGVITYLHLKQRVRALAVTFVVMGLGALAFWGAKLLSGAMPVSSPAAWVAVAVLLGFPLTCVVVGWRLVAERQPDARRVYERESGA